MSKEIITIYFNDFIDMSGKGIVKILLDGEEISLEEMVQAIQEEIGGSGLPEVYDMSMYIGSPFFGALDIMWDYDTSIVSDKKVDAVQDMFDKKFKREFIEIGKNPKRSSTGSWADEFITEDGRLAVLIGYWQDLYGYYQVGDEVHSYGHRTSQWSNLGDFMVFAHKIANGKHPVRGKFDFDLPGFGRVTSS